jgi:hypothetical protein
MEFNTALQLLDGTSPSDLSTIRRQQVTHRLPLLFLALAILCTEFMPPLPVYLQVTNTLAFGTIAAGALVILLVAANTTILAAKRHHFTLADASVNSLLFVGLLIVLVCVHEVVAARLVPMDSQRFVLSLIPLFFLLAGGLALGSALRSATPNELHTVSWICFWIFVGIVVQRMLGLEPLAADFHKPTFPFTETSHFALAFGPIYLYRSVTAPRQHKLMWIAFGLALAVLLKSATLVAFAFGAALLCRRLLLLMLAVSLVFVGGATAHLSYFTSRADISSHSKNISALVYLQGWEFIWRSLILTHGWGLGFQQLGIHPFNLAVTRIIRGMNNGKALNTMGGSFTFSKLASEFGVFGIALAIAYLYFCFQSIRILRATASFRSDTFARCIIVAFGVDMFIRGIGYFYGDALLFWGAVFSLAPSYAFLRHGVSRSGRELLVVS